MENKTNAGIQDHWMKSMMESHNSGNKIQENRQSVKREREINGTMAEVQTVTAVVYKTVSDLKLHQETIFQCDICDQTFDSMEFLLLHKKFHAGGDKEIPIEGPSEVVKGPKKRRKFKCDMCDVKVNSQYHLDIHRSKHEGTTSKKYVCEICERSFVAPQFLKSHKMTHSNTSTINCEICGKSFTGQAYLKLHMQLHTEAKKFKCTKCDELFPTKNCMKIHMKKHSKVKNFKCDYCGKQFVSKITMEKHRQSHEARSVDCLVNCSLCDRSMLSSLLRTHTLRAHPPSNDDDVKRPHKCETCGKNFIVKINLNLHIRICHPELAEQQEEDDSSNNEE